MIPIVEAIYLWLVWRVLQEECASLQIGVKTMRSHVSFSIQLLQRPAYYSDYYYPMNLRAAKMPFKIRSPFWRGETKYELDFTGNDRKGNLARHVRSRCLR